MYSRNPCTGGGVEMGGGWGLAGHLVQEKTLTPEKKAEWQRRTLDVLLWLLCMRTWLHMYTTYIHTHIHTEAMHKWTRVRSEGTRERKTLSETEKPAWISVLTSGLSPCSTREQETGSQSQSLRVKMPASAQVCWSKSFRRHPHPGAQTIRHGTVKCTHKPALDKQLEPSCHVSTLRSENRRDGRSLGWAGAFHWNGSSSSLWAAASSYNLLPFPLFPCLGRKQNIAPTSQGPWEVIKYNYFEFMIKP